MAKYTYFVSYSTPGGEGHSIMETTNLATDVEWLEVVMEELSRKVYGSRVVVRNFILLSGPVADSQAPPPVPRLKPLVWSRVKTLSNLKNRAICPWTGDDWWVGKNDGGDWIFYREQWGESSSFPTKDAAIDEVERIRNEELLQHLDL